MLFYSLQAQDDSLVQVHAFGSIDMNYKHVVQDVASTSSCSGGHGCDLLLATNK